MCIFILQLVQGRAWSRAKSRRNLDYMDVLHNLEAKGISIRVASPKLVMEEVSWGWKDFYCFFTERYLERQKSINWTIYASAYCSYTQMVKLLQSFAILIWNSVTIISDVL